MGVWLLLLLLLPVQFLPDYQPLCVHHAGDHHGAVQGHHEPLSSAQQPPNLTK